MASGMAGDEVAIGFAGVPMRSALAVALAASPLALLLFVRPWLEVVFPRAWYLPLHASAELLVVAVAFAAFVVMWFASGAGVFVEARARFVGAAFLAVALLEALHLFAFPGMPSFLGGGTTERGIYYWLAARIWTVGSLLGALAIRPSDAHPLLRRGPLLAMNLGAVAALVALDAALPADRAWFFVEGDGLTPLKIAMEGAAGLAAGIAAVLYARRARATGDDAQARLSTALGLSGLAAASLMAYRTAYDPFNLLGHVYLMFSAWTLLQALFVTAVVRPHAALARSNAALERLRGHVQGELADTIAQLRDATRREAAARAQLEAAFAAVPGALLTFSNEGTIVSANAAAERLLGTAAAPGRTHAAGLQILSPATADGAPVTPEASPVTRALRGETVQGVLLRLTPPGRAPVWAAASAAPVRIGDGGNGAVAVFADVSDLVLLQEQREDLLRAVSHDLRNPLQIVLLQAQRLARLVEQDAKAQRAASAVFAAGRRMELMIRDLVESARLERGALVLRREPVPLRSFLSALLADATGVLEVARVRNLVPEELPAVDADPGRLDRILMNLVGNALKYSSAGEVEVRAAHEGGTVRVSVVDRGPGISPNVLPHLFERWQRGGVRSGDGLGLGLYIVRKLVEAHGGAVHAESVPGQGSTFEFTLPAAQA